MHPLVTRAVHRLTVACLGLIVLSVLVFALVDAAPGHASDEARLEGVLSEDAAARRDASAERPWPARYLTWLRGAATADLGESRSYGRPVGPLVIERLGNTLLVALPALVAAWLVGLPAGLGAALAAGRWLDRGLLALSSALLAAPEVITAFVLMWVVVRLGLWHPAASAAAAIDADGSALDLASLLPPVVLVFVVAVPSIARTVRFAALTVLDEPFVRQLHARGVSSPFRLATHVVKAALPPLLTLFSSSLSLAIGGAVVAEVMFSWPGVGALLYRATLSRDEPLVAGTVMMTALCLVIVNVCGELLADGSDPRAVNR